MADKGNLQQTGKVGVDNGGKSARKAERLSGE
jgi:hypothetical protein